MIGLFPLESVSILALLVPLCERVSLSEDLDRWS